MRFLTDARAIIQSALGSALYAIVIAGALAGIQLVRATSQGQEVRELSFSVWVFIASHCIFGVCLLMLFRWRYLLLRRGRLETMEQNLTLLRERSTVPPESSVIRSTRLSRWPVNEISAMRTAFREELDKAVLMERRTVQRLWNVKDAEDVARLIEVLGKYEGRSNVTIKAYWKLPAHLLPELLIVNGIVASISLPQAREPRGLEAGQTFRNRPSVKVIDEYFEVLWSRADSVLDAGVINRQLLASSPWMTCGITHS